MKERYRTSTACLSLLILALVSVTVSDKGIGRVCAPLVFAAGAALYAVGAVYDRRVGKKTGCCFQWACSLLFLIVSVLSALRMGGIL